MSERILDRNLIDVASKTIDVAKSVALLPISFVRELHNRLGWKNILTTVGLTLLPLATGVALWSPPHSLVVSLLGASAVAGMELLFVPRLNKN